MYPLKLTMFSFVILFGNSLFAQETPTIPDFRKIQTGITISPDYCFRTLKNNDGSASSNTVISLRNSTEIPKLGYTAGLHFIYNFTKRTGIEIGVQYSNKGYQSRLSGLTFGSMIDPRRGSTPGAGATKAKIIYNDYYLDIPLKVNFTLGEKKIRFVASAGITTNIFIKETETIVFEYKDGSHTREKLASFYNYNQVDLSPTVSAGIDCQLNSRNHLKIEPVFRYGVLKIINTPVTGYLWNAGLNIGYYFGL